jgi:hypothetical protein
MKIEVTNLGENDIRVVSRNGDDETLGAGETGSYEVEEGILEFRELGILDESQLDGGPGTPD